MTEPFLPRNSTRRRFLIGLAGWGIGYGLTNEIEAREMKMATIESDLWHVIETLAKKMPLTPAAIESVFGLVLREEGRNDAFVHVASTGPVELMGGQVVSNLSLLTKPSLIFDEKSAFAFEVNGPCVGIDVIREQYGELLVTQSPRGGSMEETTVYSRRFSWGFLSFAFKAEKPDCLFRVSFRQQIKGF